jgi:hypothetical protein
MVHVVYLRRDHWWAVDGVDSCVHSGIGSDVQYKCTVSIEYRYCIGTGTGTGTVHASIRTVPRDDVLRSSYWTVLYSTVLTVLRVAGTKFQRAIVRRRG